MAQGSSPERRKLFVPDRLRADVGKPGGDGIVTVGRVPLELSQRALVNSLDPEKGAALMHALDACNRRWGHGAIGPATTGIEPRRALLAAKLAGDFEVSVSREFVRGEVPSVYLRREA